MLCRTAWIDENGALRTYRHAPNTGSRKSWAAGDATSRAVRLALIAMTGEMGYPSALTARTWGYYDVLFKGKPFELQRGYGSSVMENVLFKISYPAEFQFANGRGSGNDAARRSQRSHRRHREDRYRNAGSWPHEASTKPGRSISPADRDHCIQYMVAVPLIFGRLSAADYEDDVANDPRIDLRCARPWKFASIR